MAALSVILCTHNPRCDHFDRCLAGLKAQTLLHDKWELIVIDNASQSSLVPCADISWHKQARLVHERVLGLTRARLRGIHEATGDLLVFVDDDNVLDADFLETALRIAEQKPFLGSWSGQCRPEFEKSPAEWTRRYWGNLAVREFSTDTWSNLPRLAATMPSGAGLCVRREVARHYLLLHETGKRSLELDRIGNSLVSGGDNDLAACACHLDRGVGLIASLKLTHLIPPERLTEDYLALLVEGIYLSSTLLDSEYGVASVRRRSMLGRLADALRVLLSKPPHRRILRAAHRGRDRALLMIPSSRVAKR